MTTSAALCVLWGTLCLVLARSARADGTPDDRGSPRPQPEQARPGWTLSWSDEFEGPAGAPPNASTWNVYANATHGDLEQQLYVASAAKLDGNGHLVLATARVPSGGPPVIGPDGKRRYSFTSGWVDTEAKVELALGRWEIRARLPNPEARGIWPAHWLMPRYTQGGWNCWPVGGEIDIMEATGGVYNNTVLGTYHWGANCSKGPPPPPPGAANCTCGCGCDLHKLSKFGGQLLQCAAPHRAVRGWHTDLPLTASRRRECMR